MTQIKELIEKGLALNKIAKKLNLTIEHLSQEVEVNHYTLKTEIFNESKINRICDLYAEGVSIKTLGIKFSIDKRRIKKWIKEKGILRDNSQVNRLHFFNEHIFDAIDSPQKAYWLGFLFADGYNNVKNYSVCLTLAAVDKQHIEKYCDFIGAERKNIVYGSTTMDSKDINGEIITKKFYNYGLTMNCKHYSQNLNKLGCVQAKSHILKYPEWLDKKLHSHFIRGYFDGDGSLGFSKDKNQLEWKLDIISTKEFCHTINELIYLNTSKRFPSLDKLNNDPNKNTYSMRINGNEQVLKVCDWMYADSYDDILLTRKHNDKYLKLQKQQQDVISKRGREGHLLTLENIDFSFDNQIIEMYKSLSATKISENLNLTLYFVLDVLKRNNIEIKNETSRKFKLNQNYFENIDSENKVYWLAYIYYKALFHKNNFTIELVKDKEERCLHLYKLAKELSPENYGDILKFYNNKYATYILQINSKKLIDDVLKYIEILNVTEDYTELFSNELLKHFVRGAFDAVGTVKSYTYYNSANIKISKKNKQVFKLKKIIKYNCDIDFNGDFDSITKSGKEVIKLFNWMYNGINIKCDYRYNKVTQILKLNL